MPESTPATFLVNADTDPVQVKIEGRACFSNSASLGDFFSACIKQGKRDFLVDFQNCPSVDSTFLGVLAGAGLALRKFKPAGVLRMTRLNARNLETMRNLGITRLCQVVEDPAGAPSAEAANQALPQAKRDELAQAKHVLSAHEMLCAADQANQAKFQDVLTFMRDRVAKG